MSSKDNSKMKHSLPCTQLNTLGYLLLMAAFCLDVVCVRGMSLQVCLKSLVALCFSYWLVVPSGGKQSSVCVFVRACVTCGPSFLSGLLLGLAPLFFWEFCNRQRVSLVRCDTTSTGMKNERIQWGDGLRRKRKVWFNVVSSQYILVVSTNSFLFFSFPCVYTFSTEYNFVSLSVFEFHKNKMLSCFCFWLKRYSGTFELFRVLQNKSDH